jgi:hypothetical protein
MSEERVDECPEEQDLSNDAEDQGGRHEEYAREDAKPMTRTFRRGSLIGPMKATAITKWPNASQSVP